MPLVARQQLSHTHHTRFLSTARQPSNNHNCTVVPKLVQPRATFTAQPFHPGEPSIIGGGASNQKTSAGHQKPQTSFALRCTARVSNGTPDLAARFHLPGGLAAERTTYLIPKTRSTCPLPNRGVFYHLRAVASRSQACSRQRVRATLRKPWPSSTVARTPAKRCSIGHVTPHLWTKKATKQSRA